MLSICETDTVNFYYFSFAAKPRRSFSHFYLRRGTSTQIYKSILSFLSSFLSSVKRLKEAFRGQKSTGTWVIEATDFRIEVRSDL